MADMEAFTRIASEHPLALLEDAAHAWGSQLKGRGAGTWGRCGTFSFQVTKNITAGEGGILVTDDEQLADLCRSFTHCGRAKDSQWYDHDLLGSNLRMTEFQAAVLLAQLSRLESQVQRREQNARRLTECLREVPGLIHLAATPQMSRRSYHMYIFRVDEDQVRLSRNQFLRALNAEGVPASEGWYRPLYRNGLFQRAHEGALHGILAPLANKGVDYRDTSCPVCEQVCEDAIWIPHQVLLTDLAGIESVARAIRKVVAFAEPLRSVLEVG